MKLYIKLFITVILLFLILTSSGYSQEIKFEITEALVYINGEIDRDETRKFREYDVGDEISVFFYPDTESIEIEVNWYVNHLIKDLIEDDLLVLNHSGGGSYNMLGTAEVRIGIVKYNVELALKRVLRYIRGATFTVNLEGTSNGNPVSGKIIVEMNRL